MSARRRRTFRLTRDLVTYAVGLGGIIVTTYQILFQGGDHLPVLIAFIGVVVAPKVLGKDEKERDALTTKSEESDSV